MFGLSPGLIGGSPPWYQGLYSPADSGLVFDFTKLSSMFQDTSHTVPVTTAGDPINSIRCQITGAYAVVNDGSCTLGYDSTRKLFRAELDSSCNFSAAGAVSSAFSGNTLLSLITACEFVTNQTFLPAYIGTDYPSAPSSGGCITLVQEEDPGYFLEFVQVGGGRGFQGTQQNGVGVYIGAKTALVGPNDSNGPFNIYANGSLLGNASGNTATTSALGAITDLNFNIGRGGGAGIIYSTGCISRPVTTAEVARITARGLKG